MNDGDRDGAGVGVTMTLQRICSVDDVPAGEVRRFELDHRPIAVVNLGDDGFRAVDAICSHAHYFLDEGEVDADFGTIECPKHGSTFDLETGRPTTLPATQPVRTWNAKVEGADVLVDYDDDERATG